MKKATAQKHKRARLEAREKIKESLDAWNKRLSTQKIEFTRIERPISRYTVEYVADMRMLPNISYIQDYMTNELAHKFIKDKIIPISYHQDMYNPNEIRYKATIEIVVPKTEQKMTKTFCDRCGKEISDTEGRTLIYAWITHTCYYAKLRMIGSNSKTNWKSDDKYICPECEESYIHWFMNPDKT